MNNKIIIPIHAIIKGIGFIYLFVPIGLGHPSLSRMEVCDSEFVCVSDSVNV